MDATVNGHQGVQVADGAAAEEGLALLASSSRCRLEERGWGVNETAQAFNLGQSHWDANQLLLLHHPAEG
eukprot:3911655-Rhodomonas_salina.2